MNRTVMMTLGFLFVFLGIQLNVIDSYVLTPRVTTFLADNNAVGQPNPIAATNPDGSPFIQAAYANNPNAMAAIGTAPQVNQGKRIISPPSWIGWPIMFLGAVFFLNGFALPKK